MPRSTTHSWKPDLVTDAASTRQRVDELLRRHRPTEEHGAVAALDHLCRVACDDLAILGVTATMLPDLGAHVVAAASSAAARVLEEAQFGVGEGPTRDAFSARRPVLISDLEGRGLSRWPGWAPVALDAGVCAAYALPLHVGASSFGVLTFYVDTPPVFDTEALQTALVFAEIATEILLDGSLSDVGHPLVHVEAAIDTHAQVFQAQGMVMVALAVSLPEALARMRAHAWATGLDLTTLAGEIVAGRLTLPRDDPLNP